MGEEGADMSKWEGLKPGTTLIVRGNYMYDKYSMTLFIMPYDVLQVEREQRQDTAPDGEKRVELHLHTKSSSMDGFNDPRQDRASGSPHGPPRHCHHRPRRLPGYPEADAGHRCHPRNRPET